MSHLIAKLILSMLLLPISAAIFILLFAVATSGVVGPSGVGMLAVWGVLYAFIALYWVLLWNSSIHWTGWRVSGTIGAGVLSIAAGAAVGGIVAAVVKELMAGIMIGGGVPPILWVLGTVLLWRETPQERAARIASADNAVSCPVCGYNLTGLREARCPECGASMTLDQLLRFQTDPEAIQQE